MRYTVVSPFDSVGKISLKKNHYFESTTKVHNLKTQKPLSCYVFFIMCLAAKRQARPDLH